MRSSILSLFTILSFSAVTLAHPADFSSISMRDISPDDECDAGPSIPEETDSASSTAVIPIATTSALAPTIPSLPVTTSSTPASSASTPASSGSSAPDSASQAALDLNNQARATKNLTPFTWNATLASEAAAYAQQLAQSGSLVHSGIKTEGENLFESGGAGATFSTAVQAWLSEASSYTGQVIPQGNFGSYGHYTQCMWSSTTSMGMGAASAANGAVYIVGRYFPPGNMIGQTPFTTS
ncbi:MAG: hypothetical protein Q9227_008728 [Pyrenula ochraceoflavens]